MIKKNTTIVLLILALIVTAGGVFVFQLNRTVESIYANRNYYTYEEYTWDDSSKIRKKVDNGKIELGEIEYKKLDVPDATKIILFDTLNEYTTTRLLFADENGKIIGREELLLTGIEKIVEDDLYYYLFYKPQAQMLSYLYKNMKINKKTFEIEEIILPDALQGYSLFSLTSIDNNVMAVFMDNETSNYAYFPRTDTITPLPQAIAFSAGKNLVLNHDKSNIYAIDNNQMLKYNLVSQTTEQIELPTVAGALVSHGEQIVYISQHGAVYEFNEITQVFMLKREAEQEFIHNESTRTLGVLSAMSNNGYILYTSYEIPKNETNIETIDANVYLHLYIINKDYELIHYKINNSGNRTEEIDALGFPNNLALDVNYENGVKIIDGKLYFLGKYGDPNEPLKQVNALFELALGEESIVIETANLSLKNKKMDVEELLFGISDIFIIKD